VALIIAISVVTRRETWLASRIQAMMASSDDAGEYSSGKKTRPRGITKAQRAIRSLFTKQLGLSAIAQGGATCCSTCEGSAKKSKTSLEGPLRLLRRYDNFLPGKKSQVAITAVARELVGFMCYIARRVGSARSRSGHRGVDHCASSRLRWWKGGHRCG
jgi:hypothetical protein